MDVPAPIKELGKTTLTKAADKFVDFVITKYTGKSIKVFEAEGDIEADKVMTRWELLEKPFWLQAEAAKMGRQYTNLGNTLLKAAPRIVSGNDQSVENNDVFWGLLEHSKEISNEEMQELIAKIIAGEYNVPGTYSMSTLQILKMLGKNELELFEKIGCLLINSSQLPQALFTGQDNVKVLMRNIGIDFGKLQTLQSLGLILPNDMRNTMPNPLKQKMLIQYFDKNLIFAPENENFIDVTLPNFYGLSPVGAQIIKHLEPKYSEEYFSWLKENFRIPNYKLELV